MRLAVWNIEWAAARSRRLKVIRDTLAEAVPEIICLCEGHASDWNAEGHLIEAAADYGYPVKADRRKVMLWSRNPWQSVDARGSDDLPPGRFVSGISDTTIGPIRVLGLCVPWSHAHVSTGTRDRKPWSDHLAYLSGLEEVLAFLDEDLPTVLLGDFNQRIPAERTPVAARAALNDAIAPRFEIVTGGSIDGLADQPVCHIATDAKLHCDAVTGLSRHAGGKRLSDHDGLVAELSAAGA
ncbi:endonuclease/exonuclease/phosphatase family protein [Tepidamorphus sp. 3E244]|uniref:endonuclease/exonuclease/phosphatase family protein n=1 Tax=Tepidamorphus sp. 3E244 TaxID=3385498 RepID=UPI0038FCC774